MNGTTTVTPAEILAAAIEERDNRLAGLDFTGGYSRTALDRMRRALATMAFWDGQGHGNAVVADVIDPNSLYLAAEVLDCASADFDLPDTAELIVTPSGYKLVW